MRTGHIVAVVISALLVLTGCQKRVPVVALPPAPAPSPGAMAFDQAQHAFEAGSYDEAAKGYENYLKLSPAGGQRDLALFRMGLAYTLRTNVDWQRGSFAFRQIVEGFPNSAYRSPASLILSLHSEVDQLATTGQQRDQRIRQLTAELDRLKKIDADRRKRP